MVQPTTPTSCFSCITTPIVNSAPYQLISGGCSAISGLAQKIADFVTGIFITIVNFVKYCLCISSSTPLPAPNNPTPAVNTPTPSTTAHPTNTTAPTLPGHTTTSSAPTTTYPPVVDAALVERGKQILIAPFTGHLGGPCDEFLALLDTEENGRLSLATHFIQCTTIVPSEDRKRFISQCDVQFPRLTSHFNQIDGTYTKPQKRRAVQIFAQELLNWGHITSDECRDREAVLECVPKFREMRGMLLASPVFCAAADAARSELLARGPRVRN